MKDKAKKVVLVAVAMLSGIGAFAREIEKFAGINEVTQMVTAYFDPATQLIYAIGAVVGLIGGVKVYNKLAPATRTHGRRQQAGSVRVSS